MMFESWTWNAGVLRRLSAHYADRSRQLPQPLLEKLIQSRNHNRAWKELRYFAIALFDLTAHNESPSRSEEQLVLLYEDFMTRHGLLPPIPGTNFLNSFYHISQGYDSGSVCKIKQRV